MRRKQEEREKEEDKREEEGELRNQCGLLLGFI